jgi:hypothetical protein
MIKVSVLYPSGEGATLDRGYYRHEDDRRAGQRGHALG